MTDGRTDRRTDRQTDRQTDRILIARPRLHYMQRGKNRDCLAAIEGRLKKGFPFLKTYTSTKTASCAVGIKQVARIMLSVAFSCP